MPYGHARRKRVKEDIHVGKVKHKNNCVKISVNKLKHKKYLLHLLASRKQIEI